MRLILNRTFPWEALSKRVRKEQRNREAYSPTISTYRWWARRSHVLIGALIDRSREVLGAVITISDPMAGGGTVAVEAARRGLQVFAQDINPWAAFGLETTLEPVNYRLVEKAANHLVERLLKASKAIYGQAESGRELVGRLHVRTCRCESCRRDHYLFPTTLVALDRRITGKPATGWFGCPACGNVHRSKWPIGPRACPTCDFSYGGTKPDQKRIVRRLAVCPHCNQTTAIDSDALRESKWKSVIALTAEGRELRLEPSPRLAPPIRNVRLASGLRKKIPDGDETSALLANGFENWCDLFPAGQMALLDEAISALQVEDIAPPIKRRLLLALIGFAEMAGYACRWDPKYRKVYEATANHHYSRLFLSAETNPLGTIGRGTLQRRFASAVTAVAWFGGSTGAQVHCGSSEQQPIGDKTIDLVITDPPYYDSVQYAELSRLFRSFARALGLPWSDDVEKGEAVTSRALGCTHNDYVDRLTAIFRETARTVKPRGRMLLTFHHPEIRAWEAVGDALRAAGWRVVSVAVVHSENEKDFAKKGKNSIPVDAVFECVHKRNFDIRRVTTATGSRTIIAQNVLVVGTVVADYINGRTSDIRKHYRRSIARRGIKALFT